MTSKLSFRLGEAQPASLYSFSYACGECIERCTGAERRPAVHKPLLPLRAAGGGGLAPQSAAASSLFSAAASAEPPQLCFLPQSVPHASKGALPSCSAEPSAWCCVCQVALKWRPGGHSDHRRRHLAAVRAARFVATRKSAHRTTQVILYLSVRTVFAVPHAYS